MPDDADPDEDDDAEPSGTPGAGPPGTPGGEPSEAPGAIAGRGVTLDGTDDADEAVETPAAGPADPEQNPEAAFTDTMRGRGALRNISRAELREHYGPVRTLFKQREESYRSFQRQLTQAWVARTYDQYLTTVVVRMLYLVAAGAVLGVVLGVGLYGAGRAGAIPAVVEGTGLSAAALASTAAAGSTAGGVAAAGLYWAWRRVFRIRHRIANRRRDINYNLPYAVTFMYALARADVSFDRIVTRLADSPETYGAVSQEFDRVVRDTEMFGNNLYGGLENLRAVTPSEELGRLVDDLLTVLESGGDLAGFLRDEVDEQLETAVAEQESFIERLELLSEVFVVGLVAAPLFVVVVLIVVSFLGAETVGVIGTLVYVAIPLALVGFVVLIDLVSQPFETRAAASVSNRDAPSPPPEGPGDPDWRGAYEQHKRLTGLRNRLRDQVVRVRDDPWRALLFSVPLALAIPAVGVLSGAVPLSVEALLAAPVQLTTDLVVYPLVVATLPVVFVYEYRHRQDRVFERRFPDLLELLATSNRRGLSLARGLDIITDSTGGRLGAELRSLRNDIQWNADLPAAFESFGDRLPSPALTRTASLVAEGSRATSDLHVVLEVAARDTAERVRLKRERRETLQSYLVIVVVGFLVYLLVVLLLAANFLDPLAAFEATPATEVTGPIDPAAVPVDELRVLLFHSALIQGFGSGVLAGKLAENSLYSGLKYGLGLTLLAVLAFTVI